VGSKPTVILIPSLLASASTLIKQVSEKALSEYANVVVFEPLGHGATKVVGGDGSWTYWDSATAFLQAMDGLNIKKAFVLGVSQGGFIAARMALYAPDRIVGLIAIGSNYDAGPHLVQLGCADLVKNMTPVITQVTATASVDWKVPEEVTKGGYQLAIGDKSPEDIEFWLNSTSKVYVGDTGRLKLRQSILSLITRDSLHLRLADLKYTPTASGSTAGLPAGSIPVLYVRGTEDKVWSKAAAEADVEALKSAGVTNVQFVEIAGGEHAVNWTNAEEVNAVVVDFVKKYGGKKDARALREAVGMVDI